MANNIVQIKRTSVSGRAANTTTLTNPGELALNMTDGIMYSTNGSVVFEIGANLTSLNITGGIKANGSFGTSGQVLTSNGTGVYWNASSTLNAEQRTYTYTLGANTTVIQGSDDAAAVLSYTAGLESVFINGSRQISGIDYNTTNSSAITLTANAIAGEVVQVITWQGALYATNVAAQYTWTNSHIFGSSVNYYGNVTFNSGANTIIDCGLTANGSVGSDGQILTSNGVKPYWQNQPLRTSGQVVLTSNTTLNSSHVGGNILALTAGITITLPASGFTSGTAAVISNVSGGAINLSYAYAGDGPTVLAPKDSVILITDGNGSTQYWRQYSFTNILGVSNVNAVSASTVDCSLGSYFTKTASGALSWTFSNAPSSGAFSFALELTNGGSGTQTWPGSVAWDGGTAPSLQASGVDILVFMTINGGSTWRGVRSWKQA